MKYKLLAISFCLILSGGPPTEGNTQIVQERNRYESSRVVKEKLFDIAFSNQDTLTELLIRKRRPKIIVIKKPVIKYLKIYKVIPIYIRVGDSEAYNKTLSDTLSGSYYLENDKPVKHKGILYKLFHKKIKTNLQ